MACSEGSGKATFNGVWATGCNYDPKIQTLREVLFKAEGEHVDWNLFAHCPVLNQSGKELGCISRWEEGLARTHQLGCVKYSQPSPLYFHEVGTDTATNRPPQDLLDMAIGILHAVAEEHGANRYHGDLKDFSNYGVVISHVEKWHVGRPYKVQVFLIPSKKSLSPPQKKKNEELILQDVEDVVEAIFGTLLGHFKPFQPDLQDLYTKMKSVKGNYKLYMELRTTFPIHCALWSREAQADYFMRIHTKLAQSEFEVHQFIVSNCLSPIFSRSPWTDKVRTLTDHPFQRMFSSPPDNRLYTNKATDFVRFIKAIPAHIMKKKNNAFVYLSKEDTKFHKRDYVAAEIVMLFPTMIQEIYSSHSFFYA